MRNPPPYHNPPSPISIPLENASVGKPFPNDVGTDDVARQHEKGWTGTICEKTRLHCPFGKRLGASAVTQAIRCVRRARLSGKPTLGRRARRPNSRNRFLTVFRWIRRLWLPNVFTAVSVAVRWRLRRWARRMALSWRCDVTRGRPDRGRSATLPVSLRRRTRRFMVETCTPKCLANCCCLCPCISNAIASPLWTCVSRTMTNKTSTVTKLADNDVCLWSVPSVMTQRFPEHGGVISHGILTF